MPKVTTELPPEIGLIARDLMCIRDDRTLFAGLNFELGRGQMLLIEGANGCGKTSLLHILCGIREQDAGELSWCGENTRKLGPEYHEHISYLGHRDGIKLDLTPRENLRMSQALGKSNNAISVDEALDQVDLYGFEDVHTRNLSAGQQRRVGLARLLITRALLWILDEPFTSIDRGGISTIESLLEKHVNAGGMLVLTTHHIINMKNAEIFRINLSE